MIPYKFDIRYRWQGRRHHHKGVGKGTCAFPGLTLESTDQGSVVVINLVPVDEVTIDKFFIEVQCPTDPGSRIFVNGYQSWTGSREYSPKEKIPPMALWGLPWINKYRFPFYSEAHYFPPKGKKGCFTSHTFTYLRRGDRVWFWGVLDEKAGYGFLEHLGSRQRLRVHRDAQGLKLTQPRQILSLFHKTGAFSQVWQEYNALREPVKALPAPHTGWTSWYNFYEHVTQEDIHRCLEGFSSKKIPLQVFQIDDGWQKAVGEWTPNEKFSLGMEDLVEKIHGKGYEAGLWLAPFIVEQKSSLWTDHPDWFQKDRRGRIQEANFNDINWSGKVFCLNPFHPEVRTYLKDTFDRIRTWGFDLVKLDFLFAASIQPPGGKSRGEAMEEALSFIRSLWPGKILGCGVPLGAASGKFEFCRIGADVSLMWEDWRLKALGYRERVSTINSLTSTLGRWEMNGVWFQNDPDVFILREESTTLTPTQKMTLFVLNHLLGGLVFTSDDPSRYKTEHWALYRKAFPHREKKIISVDRRGDLVEILAHIHGQTYRVFTNLGKKWMDTALPLGQWFESRKGWTKGGKVELESYQTRVFLRVSEDAVALAGSENHIFPCSEVETWKASPDEAIMTYHPHIQKQGPIWIRIPQDVQTYVVNGRTYTAQHLREGRFIQVDP